MSLDMNPDVRAQWCAALRSGEYRQGHGGLRNDGKFCCLGVLCALAVHAGVLAPPEENETPSGVIEWAYGGHLKYLPREMLGWAGLTETNPPVSYGGHQTWLAHLNDDELSFAEIADLIDGGVS